MADPADNRDGHEAERIELAALGQSEPEDIVGTRIGPYKLLQEIGHGGFGVVFMAEQEQPIRRLVAIKIIKLGMDTRQVVARFEQERQALALMDHPNIARVIDAGATDKGRPYFVMELVRGVPITDYCDSNHLTMRERLELFIPVCRAMQHAHQKGIIHRDLKPSNVMVTLHDGKPVPKIIDFGIAKATDRRLTDKTLFTELHAMIGTPAYMSPEQAEMSGLDIDTRSDVYSLGVLLYELLTGTTPFSKDELVAAGYAGMQRLIREVEPPKPSTRISTLGSLLSAVASKRNIEGIRLGLLLRGDLDWVVMRALEKDRARRYDSAAGLADDVRRHLDGEPVVAAPPSMIYRMRKFARKHKGPVAAGLMVFAALVFSLIAVTWSGKTARSDLDEAKRQLQMISAEAGAMRAAANEAAADLAKTQEAVLTTKQLLAGLQSELSEGTFSPEGIRVTVRKAQQTTDQAQGLLRSTQESLEPCAVCDGTGKVATPCRVCGGAGRDPKSGGDCIACRGGKAVPTKCPACNGTGTSFRAKDSPR